MSWTVQYEANELPENATPAWTDAYEPDPLVASIVEINPVGILHTSGLVVDGEVVRWIRNESGISTAVGVTVETKIKIMTGSVMLSGNEEPEIVINDGTYNYVMAIYTDGVVDGLGNVIYTMDTTDDYHTYRMTTQNGTGSIYIDEILRGIIGSSATSEKNISFVATAANGDFEQLWDYVYYSIDGVFPATTTTSTSTSSSSSTSTSTSSSTTTGVENIELVYGVTKKENLSGRIYIG